MDAFHPRFSNWRYGRINEMHPAGLDGVPRSAEIIYHSMPGDPDSKGKGTIRSTVKRLDTLIQIGVESLQEEFARDDQWTERIINGPETTQEIPEEDNITDDPLEQVIDHTTSGQEE